MKIILLRFSIIGILLFIANLSIFAQEKGGTVQGKIETKDGKPLPYASVFLKDNKFGAMAKDNGQFKFDAPAGNYTLVVTYASYITFEKKIIVKKNEITEVGSISISSASNELREVVVADIQRNKYAKKTTATVARMPLADLENAQTYSIVNKEFMQEMIATDLNSAVVSVPGVVVSNGVNDSGNDITLRGFVTNANFRNGLVVNPRTQTDIGNIERVEVLKGPSATLFGGSMSTYGGVFNTLTKRPFESFRGEVSYTTGSWGMNRIQADINTPLNEDRTALLRINAAGFTSNSFQDAGYNKGAALAVSMAFKTSDRTTIRFDADYFAPNKTLNAYIRNSNVLTVKKISELNDIHSRTFTSNDIGTKRYMMNAQVEIEHKISDQWTSRTSYQHSESGEKSSTFLVLNYLNNTQVSRSIRPFDSYELTSDNIQQNFIGDFKIGNLRNRMVVGADYLYRKTYYQYGSFNIGNGKTSAFMPFDTVSLDPNAAWQAISRSSIQQKDNKLRTLTTGQSDINFNFSAYISDVLNVTDWIFASAALRIDRYEMRRSLTNGVPQSNNYVQTQYSPKFGLVVQPLKEQLSIFANYSNGFTNNAPSIITPTTQNPTGVTLKWDPTQANQTEFGIKTDLFGGKLSSTISYYDIKVKNIINTLPDGTQEQNGDQRSQGVEIEIIANPIKGLNIVTGYGSNNNHYTSYRTKTVDYAGNRASWVPQNVFNIWASYKISNGKVKGLGLGAGINYSDEAYLDAANKAQTPAYTLINSSLFYDQPKYRVGLKINNLGDSRYWNYYGMPQSPRQFLANISYKF